MLSIVISSANVQIWRYVLPEKPRFDPIATKARASPVFSHTILDSFQKTQPPLMYFAAFGFWRAAARAHLPKRKARRKAERGGKIDRPTAQPTLQQQSQEQTPSSSSRTRTNSSSSRTHHYLRAHYRSIQSPHTRTCHVALRSLRAHTHTHAHTARHKCTTRDSSGR